MKLEEKAELLNFNKQDGVYEKNINGFKVQMSERMFPGLYTKILSFVIVLSQTITSEQKKAIKKSLGMNKGLLLFESVGVIDNTLILRSEVNKKNVEKTLERLQRFIETLQTLNLKSNNGCPFCDSEEETDGIRVISGIKINVHEACVHQYVSEKSSLIQEQENSKGMLKSLIYAFVGAIFGAIPAMIALIGFGYFVGLLFILIPVASFYLYKFGKGPRTTLPLVIISLFSLLLVPLIILFIYSSFAMTYGYTLFEAIEIDTEFAREFYSNLGMSFLFSIIGISVAWGYMYKQSTNVSKKQLNEFKS